MIADRVNEDPSTYVPLNPDTCKKGDEHGPVRFRISEDSHVKHLDYLSRLCETASHSLRRSLGHVLTPFETWSMSRALAERYVRLNEVLLLHAERRITRLPQVNSVLIGNAKIQSITTINGLCVTVVRSRTTTEDGATVLEALDKVLLINASDHDAIRASVHRVESRRMISLHDASILATGSLRMRYTWDEVNWKNNIHTDSYARTLGFRRALIEGPALMDLVIACDAEVEGLAEAREPFSISWRHVGPVYRDLTYRLSKGISATDEGRSYYIHGREIDESRWQTIVKAWRHRK